MSKVEEKAATLVLHLLGHQEKNLRASALEEKLRGLEVEETTAILNFICNPYCPPSIAVHLLKFLLLSDLREIAQFENLPLAVKEIAHQLLRERKE